MPCEPACQFFSIGAGFGGIKSFGLLLLLVCSMLVPAVELHPRSPDHFNGGLLLITQAQRLRSSHYISVCHPQNSALHYAVALLLTALKIGVCPQEKKCVLFFFKEAWQLSLLHIFFSATTMQLWSSPFSFLSSQQLCLSVFSFSAVIPVMTVITSYSVLSKLNFTHYAAVRARLSKCPVGKFKRLKKLWN